MKNLLFLLAGLLLSLSPDDEQLFQDQPNSSENLIRYWKDQYPNAGIEAFTFEQETIRFKNGQATDTAIWYEAVQYPDHFRIDLGDKADQNINLFRNDSIYVLRKGELVRQGKEIQTSLLLEGALYELPVDSILAKLKASNINTDIFSQGTYKGRPAYIIGAEAGDETSPQIWMDATRRAVLRKISKTRRGNVLDAQYDDFVDLNGYWIESWIEFYVDGNLVQTERYKNIDASPTLAPGVFDPNHFRKYFWY